MKGRHVVIATIVFVLIFVWLYLCWSHGFKPFFPASQSVGARWGSPAMLSTIIIPWPQTADNRVDSPLPGGGGFWGWIWTQIVSWTLDPLKNCVTGEGQCDQPGTGGTGGGGGGGIPPQCGVDFCTPPGVLGAAGRQARRPRTELEEAMEIMGR